MDIFSTEVIGVTFTEDYPNNILTIKEWVDSGDQINIYLSLLPKNIVGVFCAGVGGTIGHLPYDIATLVDKQIAEGVLFKADEIHVYFAEEDVEGLRPRLNITFCKVNDEG